MEAYFWLAADTLQALAGIAPLGEFRTQQERPANTTRKKAIHPAIMQILMFRCMILPGHQAALHHFPAQADTRQRPKDL